ncbi:MAG: flavin reductase family protein [Spirosomataceae bacterium]
MKKVLKRKNYDVHSITTNAALPSGEMAYNGNIATWVMQSAMGGKELVIALYQVDYTLELVKMSKQLNVNLLAETQTNLIAALGRKSGREKPKLRSQWYALDDRGCPYLLDAVGYIQCTVKEMIDGLDHTLCICQVEKQVLLHAEANVMTNDFLREKGLVRG